ncbi:MAG TPA: phage baseplate assembly protein V [Burkholderiales bacterium]|jgi:phage baseplate assembly protein V|nr:phage baseplate assembly protein V [Burkholderiales bacterium]
MTLVARSLSTDKRFFGVEEGVVTSVDEELSKHGRVKVKLVRRDDQMELECRMCNSQAGNDYGFFFVPEVDDEVLVAFIQGDMRLPVILGGMYNGVDKPPAAHPRLRRIQSVNGHRISFIDAKESHGSKGALVIEDAHGNTVSMSNGKIVIKSVAILEIDAPLITLQGPGYKRVVAPSNNPI